MLIAFGAMFDPDEVISLSGYTVNYTNTATGPHAYVSFQINFKHSESIHGSMHLENNEFTKNVILSNAGDHLEISMQYGSGYSYFSLHDDHLMFMERFKEGLEEVFGY